MSLIRDLFSSDGRLLQLESALKAMEMGSHWDLHRHLRCFGCGKAHHFIADVNEECGENCEAGRAHWMRVIRSHGRCSPTNLSFAYDESMPIELCTQFTSTLEIQSCDADKKDSAAMSRPAGVALLLAGFDGDEPQLWHLDPSGTYTRYLAKAIGSRSEFVQRNFKAKCYPEMDVKAAVELCLITLQQAMEEPLRATTVELMLMTKDNKEYNKLNDSDMKKLPAGVNLSSISFHIYTQVNKNSNNET